MPSPGRIVRSALDRRLPLRTRLGLVAADARKRLAPRDLYRVRYGRGSVYLSRADYIVDRKSFDFAVVEGTYATDYDGAVVLDIGAHKGYYAAYAVTNGARAVVTYEPESTNLAVLERTARGYRTGVTWTIRHAAVDARSGRSDLHVMGASWGHALAPPAAFAEHEVGIEPVEVVALADALGETSSLCVESRLVVKVNIEGAECTSILETSAQPWESVSEVFVETHPWATCDASDLAAHLEPAGLIRSESAHPAVLRMRREESPRSGRHSGPR
jgi:FkbM family methyltransferase